MRLVLIPAELSCICSVACWGAGGFWSYLADASWAILSLEQATDILQMHEASDRRTVLRDLEAIERLGP